MPDSLWLRDRGILEIHNGIRDGTLVGHTRWKMEFIFAQHKFYYEGPDLESGLSDLRYDVLAFMADQGSDSGGTIPKKLNEILEESDESEHVGLLMMAMNIVVQGHNEILLDLVSQIEELQEKVKILEGEE